VLIRAGLVLVAAAQAEVGIWGLVSPRGFFTGFPGGGHHWVAAIGTYNEHLIRADTVTIEWRKLVSNYHRGIKTAGGEI